MTIPLILATGPIGKTGSAGLRGLPNWGMPGRAPVHRSGARGGASRRGGDQIVVADFVEPVQVFVALYGGRRDDDRPTPALRIFAAGA